MFKNAQSLIIALALSALLSGCATTPDRDDALQLAVAKSNAEAQRLYHVAPFKPSDGDLRTEDKHLVWDALTSWRGLDMVAKVVFHRDGSILSVNVRMQVSTANDPALKPSPSRNPDPRNSKAF